MTPTILVSIPTLNSERTLGDALLSVLRSSRDGVTVNVVDSYSTDATAEIAKTLGVEVKFYGGKLLGARYKGFADSLADYVLLMDSDQVLPEGSLARLTALIEDTDPDMVILEETSYRTDTLTERMYALDRALVHDHFEYNVSPEHGVLLPRLFRRSLLAEAFANIDEALYPVVTAHDHAIIYYECRQLSDDVRMLEAAMFHQEPPTLTATFHHFVSYGSNVWSFEHLHAYEALIRAKMAGRNRGLLRTPQVRRVATLPLLLSKFAGYHYGYRKASRANR
jgi:glycosyltransferase involved in cell wall biosynthesis